jgi:hypothetical protein
MLRLTACFRRVDGGMRWCRSTCRKILPQSQILLVTHEKSYNLGSMNREK